jgi:phosphoglycolate phosphatase-like HAD superfamily hydrolase
MVKLVSFDVDGVLSDSGQAHLDNVGEMTEKFSKELSEYPIDIPTINGLRKWVKEGKKISPMQYFYEACGFPREIAISANEHYQQNFKKKTIPMFNNIDWMLKHLKKRGLELGIITSNFYENISNSLQDTIQYFNPNLVFTVEHGADKKSHLETSIKHCKLSPKQVIYIGDQPKDEAFAVGASVNFLGVTYGWGFDEEDHLENPHKYCKNPAHLLEKIIKLTH